MKHIFPAPSLSSLSQELNQASTRLKCGIQTVIPQGRKTDLTISSVKFNNTIQIKSPKRFYSIENVGDTSF